MIASDIMLVITHRENQNQSRQKWILVGGTIAVFLAFRIAPNSESLVRWSEQLIPFIHLGWAYLMVPIVLIFSTLRKKF